MKTFKRFLASLMVVAMLLTTAPPSGFIASAYDPNISVGDVLTFGSYPQKQVVNDTLLAELDAVEKEWVSYGYYSGNGNYGSMKPSDFMKYCDFEYENVKYRAVVFSQHRPKDTTSSLTSYSYQMVNGFEKDVVYYFTYSDLEWIVLDPVEGLLLSKDMIDAQALNDTIYSGSNGVYSDKECLNDIADYNTSSLRKWLIDDFYNVAFTENEKTAMDSFEIVSDSGTVTDKVSLLSYSQALNPDYGFSKDTKTDWSRSAKGSDYAYCQGLLSYEHSAVSTRERSDSWWTRACVDVPYAAQYPYFVKYDGTIFASNMDPANHIFGVRPVVVVSDLSYITHEHNYSVKQVINATCEESGYIVFECETCKHTYQNVFSEPTGHDYVQTVVPPTEEEGYTVNTCRNCNHSYVSDIVPAIPNQVQSGNCGDNLTWTFDEETGELVITGTGDMENYSSSSDIPWYNYRSSIKMVTIEDGVTSIGDYSFSECDILTSVTIGSGVTTIGNHSFELCESLKNVTIPDGVTSIGESAFGYCVKLTSVTIGNGVTSIGRNAFFGCIKLTSVTIPDSVISIGDHTFYGCTGLTDVYFDGTETQWNQISIESNNDPLLNATIHFLVEDHTCSFGEWETATEPTCTEAGLKTRSCECGETETEEIPAKGHSYTSVVVAPNCTDGGYTIHTCTACGDSYTDSETESTGHQYNSVVVSPTCTESGYTIHTCTVCGDSYTDSETEKTDHDYTHTVIEPTYENSGYTIHTCRNCNDTYVSDVVPPMENPIISGTCGDNLTWTFDEETGELVITGTGDMENYSSSSDIPWYNYRSSIKMVTIEDGVTSIGDYAFSYCYSLASVTIPDSVISIGNYAFYCCNNLTSITIPDSVTSIGNYVFNLCNSLTNITIPDSVTSIGKSAFGSCAGLTSVTIPDSVTSISDRAFASCGSLTSVTIGSGVTCIGDYAFSECDILTSVTIGSGVTTIGNHSFELCESLKNVTIPDGVTSIGESAFGYCAKLTSVTIGNGVTSIGRNAFFGCIGLTYVYFDGTETQWNQISIESNNDPLLNATIRFLVEEHTCSFGEWETATEPTCTEAGLKTRSCECGETETEEIPAKGHSYTSVVVAPNCTDGGYTIHTCTACGDSYTDSETESTGHQYNSVVVSPTCTESGYTIHTCAGCGDSYTDSNTDPIGHDYRQTVVPPVYLEEGYVINTCSHCNDTYKSAITPATVVTGVCGDNLIWTYFVSTGELAISGTGDMYNYQAKGAPWYEYRYSIYRISIADGATSIGDYAFDFDYSAVNDMPSIRNVEIPESVTRIGDHAFETMALRSVTIPKNVVTIGEGAFFYCASLSEITVESEIASIGKDAFACCINLEKATINANRIGEDAFRFCENLATVVLGNSVEIIWKRAFWQCNKLENLVIPEGVVVIGESAFEFCEKLTSIIIPDSVQEIGGSAFGCCRNLSDVKFGNNLEYIGPSAFWGTELEGELVIPDSVITIGSDAFGLCTGLTGVTLSAGLDIAYYSFSGASGIKDVYFKGNKHQWGCLSNRFVFGFEENEGLTVHFEVPDSFNHHTFILNETIEPTCIKKGQKLFVCKCGETYVKDLPLADHKYNMVVVDADCTTGGYTVHTCSVCGDSYTDSETEATGHQYNSVVVKPNCTTGGYTIHTCTVCGDSYTDSETEPSGHDYYQTVVVPTCKEGGYTVNTCGVCDDTYISDEKGPAGHQYTSVVINPTCLNEGYTLSACNVCGASAISDKKPALGHTYIEQVTPPTCESEGYTTFTCTRGDHIYIDNRVAASGHDYEKTVFAPTCIQDGCTFNICNDCGRLHKSDVVAATGHSFGSWRTVISPAENKEGIEERYCKYCGYAEERTLPMTGRTSFTATFVADGKTVATIEFLKGTTSIAEPPVPHKDRYNGEWEDYTLGNADIVINAKYQPVALNNLSGISNNKTASYDTSTGIASVTLTASSDAKTVITQSKERVPLDIVLVVDQSGSMNSNLGGRYSKKDSLIDSANEFVNMVYDDAKHNGIDHRIAVVGFGMGSKSSGYEYPAYLNTEILTTGGRPLSVQYATKQDYQSALMSVNQNGALNGGITTAINSIDANGATAADYGLSMASSIFANNPIEAGENRQRIVIFISDGEPTYSSGFEVDVANAAIQQAHQLKNTHNATIYSVGVMTDAEAKSEKLNAFLARVSSDYMDARNIFGNADRVSETFSINVDDTDNLSAMFSDIVTENVTQTTDFDNVTVIDTVSKYFTLTSQQEKALRYSLISEYGVKNSDIEIIRNEDGTTSIKISNIKTKPIETDGKVKYTVTINYEVSANENAATAGTYPICTDDSGIIIDGNDCYERTFPVPTAEITENRNTVVFKVNGEVYAIKSVTPGSKVTVPETDFIGEYEFSGWDVPKGFVSDETLSEFDSVLIRPEYVIIWNTENGTEKVTYSPGDIIDEPEISPNANGEAFRRWNGTVPVQMPAESLEFTAVYGDHVHQYYTETTKEMTCLEDGEVKHICSVCNDSYTETVKTPGEHSWKAIAKPGSKDNTSSAYFECERCGICADKQLNYIITENEPNERGHFESLTHEFNYVDEEGNLYQPDGNIEIVTTVSDYFEGADSVNVYRIDENGNKVKCNSEYDNGVLTFETNHFSTYVFEPYYSCQSTGEHGDENGDGYCDRCDSVLKEFIDFIIKEGIDAQIDSDNHILLGNDVLNYSVEEIAGLFEFGNIYIEGKESGRIGTGDVICLTNDSGEVCNRLTAVIFGDVNGDGWYDGQDAVLVSCLANGMLTKDDVSEAVYMAADCNHDGVIDQLDVDLLNEAGTLLANVDQSKPTEVLLETSSAYVEYLDLIDQSFEIETEEETEDIPEVDAEETPETDNDVEAEDTTPEQDAKIDIFEMIMNFIKSILEMLFACISVPYK